MMEDIREESLPDIHATGDWFRMNSSFLNKWQQYGSNGKLVGYGGGLPVKKRLLKLEQRPT